MLSLWLMGCIWTTDPPRPASIAITPGDLRFVALQETAQFSATVTDEDGMIMDSVRVVWSSSDRGIVQVDAAGTATSVGNGEAAITAAVDGVSASATVVVDQIASAALVQPSSAALLSAGDSLTLRAELLDANGIPLEAPGNTELTWVSSDTQVVTVRNAEGTAALVTGAMPGAATVGVDVDGTGPSATGTAEIFVDPLNVEVLLTQTVPRPDDAQPLISGRPAILRVLLREAPYADLSSSPAFRIEVTDRSGQRVMEVTRADRNMEVPSTFMPDDRTTTVDFGIPADHVVQGHRVELSWAGTDRTRDPPYYHGVPRSEGSWRLSVTDPPPLRVVVVPIVQSGNPNPKTIAKTDSLRGFHRFWNHTFDLLPFDGLYVDVRDPLEVSWDPDSFDNRSETLSALRTYRTTECSGGDGCDQYHLGTVDGPGWGVAYIGSSNRRGDRRWLRALVSSFNSSTIAHEFGHSLSLEHARCNGRESNPDLAFPYPKGRIGGDAPRYWSFRFFNWNAPDEGEPIPPTHSDVMSYCHPRWISDYNFEIMLAHRLDMESSMPGADRGPTVRSPGAARLRRGHRRFVVHVARLCG